MGIPSVIILVVVMLIAVLRTARGSFNVTAIYSINSNINTDRNRKIIPNLCAYDWSYKMCVLTDPMII